MSGGDSFYRLHVEPFEENEWRGEREAYEAAAREDEEAEERWLARGIEDDYDADDRHTLSDPLWRDLFDGVER